MIDPNRPIEVLYKDDALPARVITTDRKTRSRYTMIVLMYDEIMEAEYAAEVDPETGDGYTIGAHTDIMVRNVDGPA